MKYIEGDNERENEGMENMKKKQYRKERLVDMWNGRGRGWERGNDMANGQS
jgi:hypothetical protein